ncbi:MAG: RNA 2',3'-cyclic phosphodiesterase [Peptococcaceae bacterium]|jgi:2'-5' RNA ligase|nr:RNA 2',3'-cyclic phosphodiesterase [Peptococcaceae bacterium]
MRLFIAINFTEKTKAALLALRDELRSRAVRGNFSLPENLHLTLAFLGECDRKQAAAIMAVMDTMQFAPIEISIKQVGRFGGRDKQGQSGAIWWAGADESKPILDLQRALTDKLISAGFPLNTRRYSPHITLGRQVVTDAAPWRIEPFGETASSIDLMKSERLSGKLTYTAIYQKAARV